MKKLICKILALVGLAGLFGCGGGGGGSSNTSPPPEPPSRVSALEFGYFDVDGNQIAETVDHVTFVMVPDWGDFNTVEGRQFIDSRIIQQLQEAKARGYTKAIVSIGQHVWNLGWEGGLPKWTPKPLDGLEAFYKQLQALGLADMVIALYPVDEPELKKINDEQLTNVLIDIKRIWPGPKLMVVYGDTHSYPGLSQYDIVGKDMYGVGAGVLNVLPPIGSNQQHVLVPGGADPWQNAPQPFYDYAKSHNNVWGICAFVWFDGAGGTQYKGIKSNGLAPLYVGIGTEIKKGQK